MVGVGIKPRNKVENHVKTTDLQAFNTAFLMHRLSSFSALHRLSYSLDATCYARTPADINFNPLTAE